MLLTPLADAPNHAGQNGTSAKFVFYFAPILSRMVRKYAYACGCLFLLLLWTSKEEEMACWHQMGMK